MNKRYWFYGSMPSQTTSEKELTDEQKKIVDSEKQRIDKDNFTHGWLGYKKEEGWDFMRHGLEIVYIEEERGNVARKQLKEIIVNRYGE
jgi:hypothetical protein